MGRPPAVVIVARHGARLDIVDKQWHLSSPAPYDPPLTYGGWSQCRALGGRIAALLRARELLFEETLKDHLASGSTQTDEPKGTEHATKSQRLRRQKKHRVFIHSSPFLRCIQTSIAIGAGISQYLGDADIVPEEKPTKPQATASKPIKQGTPVLSPIKDEDEEKEPHSQAPARALYFKPRLRVDAFLGEWLAPEYYEFITPPPNSIMMVATAKAELLRRGEQIMGQEALLDQSAARGHFPGGWNGGKGTPEASRPSTHVEPAKTDEDQLLARVAKLTTVDLRTHRERAKTQGAPLNRHTPADLKSPPTSDGPGYVPPVPPYAISPSDPIPSGYVQHARDGCVEVDFQWDSMRPPLDWGDGGTLGEEWSAMHKRFRRGLDHMVTWYSQHRESAQQLHGHSRVLHPRPYEPDDEDTDNVIVLVTHGAGCNALIGALTNQPVLLDVSMASLTMAIQREVSNLNSSVGSQPNNPDLRSPHGPTTPTTPALVRRDTERPLSQEYLVTLTASTEHLTTSPFAPMTLKDLNASRPSTPTDSTPTSSTVTRRSSRRRFDPNAPIFHERSSSMNQLPDVASPQDLSMPRPSLASGGRSMTSNESSTRGRADNGAATSTGLWNRATRDNKPRHPRTWSLMSADAEPERPIVQTPTSIPDFAIQEGTEGLQPHGEGAGALWQAHHVDESPERERGMKRRWTMTGREGDEAGV